ncbi:MAG: response regulator [Candidatus Omnitrophica bacterium]|nr:response regulator [Candidatus Omnitrophota bacterium]
MSGIGKRKILLVDDDKDMCESLSDVLSMDSEYNVSYTTSPLKALDKILTENYSLIIIDYKMPEMNGIELLKRIKQHTTFPAVFILTAFISNELIDQAKKEGAAKVLSKFIWPDEILKQIRATIG